MYFLLAILLIIIIYYVWYRIRYSKPLTDDEVVQFANGRRIACINEYYSYSNSEYSVDMNFKKRMQPNGQFYKINEKIYEFPGLAATLLKYKKHEWIIVAFEKNRTIDLMWINKGYDNQSAGLFLDFKETVNMASENEYTSILMFHNHPNINPNIYDCTKPSDLDKKTAEEYWQLCEKSNINLVKYICERGIPYRYYLKTIDTFYDIKKFIEDIQKVNGKSPKENLILHSQRKYFSKVQLEID